MKINFWSAILFCCLTITSCSFNDDLPIIPDTPIQPEPKNYATLKEALQDIEAFEIVNERQSGNYAESYLLTFRQPVDHANPQAGTFQQRVWIAFVGFDAPTVVHTCGYFIDMSAPELAMKMNANVIAVEYRYFGESVVENDPQWNYLTLRQAADDLHAIVSALKPSLKGKIVSSGVSKNGETALQYRYFYPDDVDGTVAFCAPILTSVADPRPMSYLLRESGSPEANTNMKALIYRMLKDGENGLYKKCMDYLKAQEDYQDAVMPSFTQYAYAVFMGFFNVFQNLTAKYWTTEIPDADAPDEELFQFLEGPLSGFLENVMAMNIYPYYIQQVKELGRESILTEESKAWLEGTSFSAESVIHFALKEADKSLVDTYDNTVCMKMLEEFLPTTKCPIMFVYSKNDPWTGARPEGLGNPNVRMVINPVGIHAECMTEGQDNYDEATTKAIMEFVNQL